MVLHSDEKIMFVNSEDYVNKKGIKSLKALFVPEVGAEAFTFFIDAVKFSEGALTSDEKKRVPIVKGKFYNATFDFSSAGYVKLKDLKEA